MKSAIRQIAQSSNIAWGVAVLTILAAVLVAAFSWHFRKATVDEVLKQVKSLDRDTWRKICAHRANHIPMYREALQYFNCIEIDVYIDPPAGGNASVYHPPHRNNHGLTLESLLSQEQLPSGKLWLDTKDLSKENWRGYLAQLNRLIPGSGHNDVIVETVWSGADVQAVAAAFRQRGFSFSYYLPTDEASACDDRHTTECDALGREIVATVSRGFSHLSFDYRGYEFATSIRDDLPSAMKFLTWDFSKAWPRPELLDDVEIYIINLPSA